MKKFLLAGLFISVLLIQCSDEKEPELTIQISANFTATPTTIKVGENVTFKDESTGGPDSWTWKFEGGEPENSNEQNPVITYTAPGVFRVSLTVSKQNVEDSEIRESYITVEDAKPIQAFEAGSEITFGLNTLSDFMQEMIKLDDNSLVCVGITSGPLSGPVQDDILVTKFDENLNLVWNKTIGGSKNDYGRDILATDDGGLLIAAATESSDGDIPENKGKTDLALIKLNTSGDIEWVKTYGGSEYDGASRASLYKLDNGYAVFGYSESDDADIPGKVGMADIWILEVDMSGNKTKSFSIGSSQNDGASSAVKTNSGYVILSRIGGATTDFDKAGIWLFEINSNGEIRWKSFIDGLNSGIMIETNDNGFLTLSSRQVNITDLFATKFSSTGVVEWQTSFPLPYQEFSESIMQVGDEYIIMGSSEKDVLSNARNGNAYVAKLNASGEVIQSIFFGDDKVTPAAIVKIDDDKYVVGGTKNIGTTFIDFEFWLQHLWDTP